MLNIPKIQNLVFHQIILLSNESEIIKKEYSIIKTAENKKIQLSTVTFIQESLFISSKKRLIITN